MLNEEKPIDPANGQYKPLVDSAVDQISAENSGKRKVVSSKLVSGTVQVVVGILYKLNLEITWDDTSVDRYEACVHQNLGNNAIIVQSLTRR